MWGIIPAAGTGSRIQPLAFSKELLPVGGAWRGPGAASPGGQRLSGGTACIGGATRICSSFRRKNPIFSNTTAATAYDRPHLLLRAAGAAGAV